MSDSTEMGERHASVDPAQGRREKRAISRSAFMVMLGGIFSLLAGLLNQMILAAYFGANASMDCYLTALVIPAYLWGVSLAGLSFVFIPAFVREKARGQEDEAWALAGTFFWIVAGVMTALAAVGSYYSREIITLTAPGFSPEKTTLAARMLSVLMFSAPFIGLSAYTTGIQNANDSYFWPSFGGAVNSIGNVLGVVVLSRFIGPMALPWGWTLAILLQACVTVVPVLRHGWPRLVPLRDPRVLEMGRLILPFMLFGLLTRGTGVFERYFASALPSGQISYLGYSAKISGIFQTLLATGITAAIFPAMARAYANEGKVGLAEKTGYGLRLSLAIGLPAVLITGALSVPLVHVLFQRGAFHSTDTQAVARVVMISVTSGAMCWMLSNVISRAFYVLKDTISPALFSAIGVAAYLAMGGYFAHQWGYIGLAYASLIQQLIFVIILYISVARKLSGMALWPVVESILLYGVAAAWTFLIVRLLTTTLGFLPDALNLLASAFGSALFYLATLYIVDREILVAVLEMLGVARLAALLRLAQPRRTREAGTDPEAQGADFSENSIS